MMDIKPTQYCLQLILLHVTQTRPVDSLPEIVPKSIETPLA